MCYCVLAKSIAIGVPLASVLIIGLSRREQSKPQISMVMFRGLQTPAGSLMMLPFRRWVCAEEEAEEKAESESVPKGGDVSLQRMQRSRSRGEDDELN